MHLTLHHIGWLSNVLSGKKVAFKGYKEKLKVFKRWSLNPNVQMSRCVILFLFFPVCMLGQDCLLVPDSTSNGVLLGVWDSSRNLSTTRNIHSHLGANWRGRGKKNQREPAQREPANSLKARSRTRPSRCWEDWGVTGNTSTWIFFHMGQFGDLDSQFIKDELC